MDHPISMLMKVSLENLKEMIDVNTIVGKTIMVSDTIKVIPISKVKCGFMSGGTEISAAKENADHPFGGGTGGTMSITPVAFLVCNQNEVKVIHLEHEKHLWEHIVEFVPSLANKITDLFKDEAEEQEA